MFASINPMNRKPLIITISIGLIIILGALGWYLFTRTKTPPVLVPTNGGSPFGQGGADVPIGSTDNTPAGTGLDAQGHPVAKLFRLVDEPVAGSVAFIKNGFVVVRYAERATGHIIDVNPVTLERTKITNNTYPKIYEAYFKKDATGVIYRSLKDTSDIIVNTSISLIPPKATSTDILYTLLSTTLIGDIGDITVINDNTLVYTTKDTGSVIHSGFGGEKQTNLFTSQFTDWKVNPLGTNILLTTKASAGVAGYSYILNIKGGGLNKILGPLNGLSVSPSSDGKMVAYSYGEDGRTYFRTLDLIKKSVSEIIPVTLGEKCVFSNRTTGIMICGVPVGGIGPNEPDSWYQGSTHFTDRVWRFNTETGFTDVLADPKKEFNVELDVENAYLSPDEDYLFFTNKNDLSLWALKLN